MDAAARPTASRRPGPLRRLRLRLRRGRLDERILSYASEEDPDVADRSALLVEPARRRKLARQLQAIADEVVEPEGMARGPATLRLRREEIAASRPELLALCRDLSDEPEVSPRGVILVDRLLRDGRSPLYTSDSTILFGTEEPLSLETAIRHARTALLMS